MREESRRRGTPGDRVRRRPLSEAPTVRTTPAGRAGAARHAAPSRGARGWRHTGRVLAVLLSATVLLGCGYGYVNLKSFQDKLATTDVIDSDAGGEKPRDGAVDILLVGMDSRTDAKGNPLPAQVLDELQAGGTEDGGLNTDTMILLHMPNDGGKAVAISFPRDSYVEVAGGYGKHKLNSAYAAAKNDAAAELGRQGVRDPAEVETRSRQAGAKNLIATVQDLTGVTVDHYAEVNLAGFYEITKAVGGVDVCLVADVDEPMSGARFTAGRHTVQGRDALAFVRQRYDLPRGDLDRIVRQQVFLAGLARKVLSAGVLTDQAKLRGLIDAVTKSVVLDKDWDVLGFAGRMQDLTGGAIEFTTIPTGRLDLATPGDGMAVEVDPGQVRAFVQSLTHDPGEARTTPTTTATTTPGVTVDVRNGSGEAGLAAAVLKAVVARGYQEGTAANAENPLASSVVLYGTGAQAGAQAVAKDLGGLPTRADAVVPAGYVRVFLGQDYQGPRGFTAPGAVGLDGAHRQPVAEEPTITADGVRCVN
ncbi:LCP family protein [Saccharothrix obliqua]|uniref:LCP family protein n=1 Tax=Saccharothrix obliqua TaxID=2861747 RepID=UPI001C5EB6FB|nr:LCP family protein [Saccharothrix obliqua]MBW4720481.1 LCP family protein [Saccharothrix obliqua]